MNLQCCQTNIQKTLVSAKMKKEYFDFRYINSKKNKKVLYIHMPFCIRKCKYCVCQSKVLTNSAEKKEYIEQVLYRQIEEYRGILEKVCFEQFYFGGGTPTILSVSELERLFDKIPNLENIPIKCIECSPETLSMEHLDLLKRYNFNFTSIGVQSLNKKICQKQNRDWLSKDEICHMSEELTESGIYFNYDLICFMDKGDIRDLKEFKEDLLFIMDRCKPSSITIHQLQQSIFTCEKTAMLQKVIKEALEYAPEYQCVNSLLNEEDIYHDTVYQAEYRLARRDYAFSHYMWNKYAALPVKGYDILSIGYTDKVHTISNVGQLFYSPGESKIKWVEFNSFIYEDYDKIRKEKGFDSCTL